MINLYFYIYPLHKIKHIFPQMQKLETEFYLGIVKGGWNPDMVRFTDQIFPIIETEKDGLITLKEAAFCWDPKLGVVLTVDSNFVEDCCFLNEYKQENKKSIFKISLSRTSNSIGSIINMPLEKTMPPTKRKMFLK